MDGHDVSLAGVLLPEARQGQAKSDLILGKIKVHALETPRTNSKPKGQ